jgi:DNA repair protein RadC
LNSIKIKDIPPLERPYERLINCGVDKLSNEELLAILLKTGTKMISSKMLATTIMANINKLSALRKINYQQLVKIKGIGRSKACVILAAIELGNRINKEYVVIKGLKIINAQLVYDYYQNIFQDKYQEYFYCLYLDNAKRVIEEKLLFIGTLNFSIVHPREVFKEAYLVSASAIICVHNHPSGNIEPSIEDKNITNSLKEVGDILGIKVLDHIIIGYDNYYSFFESGLI